LYKPFPLIHCSIFKNLNRFNLSLKSIFNFLYCPVKRLKLFYYF
jgi:hypothetical protein